MFNRAPKVEVLPLELVMRELQSLIATAGMGFEHAPGVTWTPNQNAKIFAVIQRLESAAVEVHLKNK